MWIARTSIPAVLKKPLKSNTHLLLILIIQDCFTGTETIVWLLSYCWNNYKLHAGTILYMRPVNVTSSLIGWAHTQKIPGCAISADTNPLHNTTMHESYEDFPRCPIYHRRMFLSAVSWPTLFVWPQRGSYLAVDALAQGVLYARLYLPNGLRSDVFSRDSSWGTSISVAFFSLPNVVALV